MEKLMSRLDDVILWLTEAAKTEIPPFIEEAYRWWVIRDTIGATVGSVVALLTISLGVICYRRRQKEMRKEYGAEDEYLVLVAIFSLTGTIFTIMTFIAWMTVIQAHVAPKLYILSNLKSILH